MDQKEKTDVPCLDLAKRRAIGTSKNEIPFLTIPKLKRVTYRPGDDVMRITESPTDTLSTVMNYHQVLTQNKARSEITPTQICCEHTLHRQKRSI